MKIAYIVPSLANKGPIVATERLINSLKSFAEIELFYFDEIIEINIDVVKHKISFFQKVNFEHFDIVHSTGLRPDLFLLKNRNQLYHKSISSVHCYIKEDLTMLYGIWKSSIAVFLWKKALKKMKAIVVSSNYMADYYKKLLSIEHGFVIPYAVELPEKSEISAEDDRFINSLREKYYIIGNVSLLIKRKGLEQLIEFLKVRKDCAVIIIGDGELKSDLLTLAANVGVLDRFFILGFKNNSFRYYKYFDIYAMPSRSEGFSLATLEAFASKIPVVSTRLPYYEEFFNDKEICYFELDNILSLTTAVDKAIANRNDIVANASVVFNNLFTLESLSQSHLKLYEKIIKEKNDL